MPWIIWQSGTLHYARSLLDSFELYGAVQGALTMCEWYRDYACPGLHPWLVAAVRRAFRSAWVGQPQQAADQAVTLPQAEKHQVAQVQLPAQLGPSGSRTPLDTTR